MALGDTNCTTFPVGKITVLKTGYGAQVSPNGTWAVTTEPSRAILHDLKTGKKEMIDGEGSIQCSSFSPNGRFIAIGFTSGVEVIRNIDSGKEYRFSLSGGAVCSHFSADGAKIALLGPDRVVHMIDLKTGKETKLPMNARARKIAFSKDGAYLSITTDTESVILDTRTGSKKHFDLKNIDETAISENGKWIVSIDQDGKGTVRNVVTGKIIQFNLSYVLPTFDFSPDGDWLIARTINAKGSRTQGYSFSSDAHSQIMAINLRTGKTSSKDFDHPTQKLGWIDNSRKIFDSGAPDPNLTVIDPNTLSTIQKIEPPGPYARPQKVSSDGKYIVYDKGTFDSSISLFERWLEIQDIENGKVVSSMTIDPTGGLNILGFANGSKRLDFQSAGNQYFWPIESVCARTDFQLEPNANRDCPFEDKSASLSASADNTVSRISQAALCSADFEPKPWDAWIGPLKNPVDIETAVKLLLRFQKPGGFDPALHLPHLIAILNSDFPLKQPGLVAGALQAIALKSNALYKELAERGNTKKKYLKIASIEPTKQSEICRTESEKAKIASQARDYLDGVKNSIPARSKMYQWKTLRLFRPFLEKLSQAQKEEYIDLIAQSLADAAADDEKFHGIFLSKLYKLAYQAVAPFFGIAPKAMTDLTLQRTPKTVLPIVLGTAPIDGNPRTETPYGFYSLAATPIEIPGSISPNLLINNSKLEWRQDDKKYTATLRIAAGEKKTNIVPEGNAPRYDELWKDGVLHGIIVTGTNLVGDAAEVMDEYLKYYRDKGFKFPETSYAIPHLKEFLQQQIVSGEADYLIKEAHSDGDEKNLFRLDQKARALRGVRTEVVGGKDVVREIVDLVFPEPGEPKSELLSNAEFGQWIRSREKSNKGQFVYFNTSCWSKTKAVHEVEAASSLTLLNIPATTSVHMFTNSEKGAEYQLLTGFRERKNYQQMRDLLMKNPEYQSKSENVFIFPDEPTYKDTITNLILKPLDIKLDIRDPAGRPYSIEQAH